MKKVKGELKAEVDELKTRFEANQVELARLMQQLVSGQKIAGAMKVEVRDAENRVIGMQG